MVRFSLNHKMWIFHALGLYRAGCENQLQFLDQVNRKVGRSKTATFGFASAYCLLFAVTIEVVLKARILFENKDRIQSGEIENFMQLKNEWNGSGHKISQAIEEYGIEMTTEEDNLIEMLEPYMSWGGRFPTPLKNDDVEAFENGEFYLKFSSDLDKRVRSLLDRQLEIMEYKIDPDEELS